MIDKPWPDVDMTWVPPLFEDTDLNDVPRYVLEWNAPDSSDPT